MIENFRYAQELTSPNQFALVSTLTSENTTNLMALSWWTYVSNNPPTIAICIGKKGYSNELVKNNQEFGLNIVDESLKDSAFLCGTCSGRIENKPQKFGIELIDSIQIDTKLVKEHKVAFECRLIDIVEVADHSVFIAEVVACHTNPDKKQLFALDGYRSLGTVKNYQEDHL